MRRVIPLTLLALACALPARAGRPSDPAWNLLSEPDTPAALRAALFACADSAAARHPYLASAALFQAGLSFQRAGSADSAIVCLRRAATLFGEEPHVFALVDQLLLRNGPGDAAEARQRLVPDPEGPEFNTPGGRAGRVAWALFLEGKTDSAAQAFEPLGRVLLAQPEWRYRMARVAQVREDYRRVVELLVPNAVRSRATDEEVLGMLEEAGKALGVLPRVQRDVTRRIEARDAAEAWLAGALGGKPVRMTASDRFQLGGCFLPPQGATDSEPARAPGSRPGAGSARPGDGRLAIVLLAPGDSLGSADSLTAALRRHGLTSLLLYPRGSGTSVGAACPTPEAWLDREEALQTRVAKDVLDAVKAAHRLAPLDSTRYVVVGVGASAPIAVQAATLDPRARALVLVSPAPAEVDLGGMRARLARVHLPVFFQVAAEDADETRAAADLLYPACDRSASRVVQSATPGMGASQFRSDPALAARLLTWLDETVPPAGEPRSGRRGPPPTRPAPHR
jgi:hypothetical protein